VDRLGRTEAIRKLALKTGTALSFANIQNSELSRFFCGPDALSLTAIKLLNLQAPKTKYLRIFVCFTFNKHKNGVIWKNK
jgi:hypothetical protein